jgi:membrane protease YdiL (CAAX protease family)
MKNHETVTADTSQVNVFYILPRGLSLTLTIIAAITVLVIIEKTLAPRIRMWGDAYPALLSFLVILSKTVIPLVLLWKVYRLKPGSLGWVRGGFLQAVWKGIILAVIMMIFMVIYQKYSYILFQTPYTSSGQRFLGQKLSGAALGIGISAALLNAFGEEIIFRGMLLPALSRYLGTILVLIVQAFVFSAYHLFPLQNSVFLFIMGIVFGLGYLWSGSLLTPVLAHLIENGVPILIFLLR